MESLIEPDTNKKLKILLCSAAFLALLAAFFWTSSSYIGNDEMNYLYEAHQLSYGEVPFKDFPSRSPTQIFLMTIIEKTFGPNILATKIYSTGLFALIGLFVYLILRSLGKSRRISAFAAFITLITPTFFLSKLVLSTTNLAIVLVLASFYLLRQKRFVVHALAGSLLSLAVFTRESVAIFIAIYLLYLVIRKEYRTVDALALGASVITVPMVSIFAYAIGFSDTLEQLFGIGHLFVQEKFVTLSLHQVLFFTISILPFIATALLIKKRFGTKNSLPHLEIIWIASMAMFYGLYWFKRSFTQDYGSEFIPFAAIVIFSLCDFEFYREKRVKLYATLSLFTIVPTLVYPFIQMTPEKYKLMKEPSPTTLWSKATDIGFLIGTGIPKENFEAAKRVIEKYSDPGDGVLSGTMSLPLETGLRQFKGLSRILIYEKGATLYKLYDMPDHESFASEFMKDPTDVVIVDHHLAITLYDDLKDFLSKRYVSVYTDDFVEVLVLKDRQTTTATNKIPE